MISLEICAQAEVLKRGFVVVQDGSDLTHVGPAIVVLGTKRELAQVPEPGNSFRIEMPATNPEIGNVNKSA